MQLHRTLKIQILLIAFILETHFSKDKCDYLAKLAKKMEIDVIVLQETHTGTEEQLHSRGLISGYILVDHLCSSIYGLATYVKREFMKL
jgi:exonuclease III